MIATGSSCRHAVSKIHTSRHGLLRVISAPYQPHRRYAQPTPRRPDVATAKAISNEYSAKAALAIIESRSPGDPVNPARSTLPPPLDLPERDAQQNFFLYWFHIGRAYGTFYKEGVKAVWFNNKATRLLRERIKQEMKVGGEKEAASQGLISRSEWQLLQRNNHDIGKLPLFGLLAVIFGEWLPILVPFLPGVVPGTCRIPKQVRGMRAAAEERRRIIFRTANFEPEQGQLSFDATGTQGKAWPVASADYIQMLLKQMRDDQLHHLSTTLGLHSRLWDRVQLYPIGMRRKLTKHLQYLSLDDRLLSEAPSSSRLSVVELEEACTERGLDVLGRPEATLRENLSWWLKRQEEDRGRGRAMLSMLFRRSATREWVKLHLDANKRD
ncbi:hypothetical protein LTR56_013909 [Elasticomyces elasticus]|nr:hypothetical protein LTR56_013909 [Elasticomyces elasticus]KAK3656248.1 hypothetical protein LTR22_009821 [Elasticomyces elasticus]